MRFSGWIASVACGGVLLGQLATAGAALAQDATVPDNEGSHQSNVAAKPAIPTPPAIISGCWSGSTDDDAFGAGTAFFKFGQDERNPKKIFKAQSNFDFEWPDAFAFSPIAGVIKGSAFKVHGNAGHCPITFVGVVNQAVDEITGSYQFNGKCRTKEGFAQGTFDVTPTSCL